MLFKKYFFLKCYLKLEEITTTLRSWSTVAYKSNICCKSRNLQIGLPSILKSIGLRIRLQPGINFVNPKYGHCFQYGNGRCIQKVPCRIPKFPQKGDFLKIWKDLISHELALFIHKNVWTEQQLNMKCFGFFVMFLSNFHKVLSGCTFCIKSNEHILDWQDLSLPDTSVTSDDTSLWKLFRLKAWRP